MPDDRGKSIRCPMFNPFERALVAGEERREILVVTFLLVVFILAVVALDVWMALQVPSTAW